MSEEIKLLSQLTIVIPTYNRPLELQHSIEYWRDTAVIVHYLDGSVNPLFSEGLLSGTRSLYYHHMPSLLKEDPSIALQRRLLNSSHLPETKYSAVCSDDDFYTLSGLSESIKCLELNNKIDAVSGSVLHYRRKRQNLVWNFHHRVRLNYKKLETSSLETRVENESTTWVLRAVCRTLIWKQYIEIFNEIRGFTETQFHAHEFIMVKLSKAMFQTKHLNMLTLVRQHTIVGWNIRPKITWKDWLLDESNTVLIEEIADQLSKGFNAVSSATDVEKNRQIAERLMAREREKILSRAEQIPNLFERIRRVVTNIIFKVLPNLKVFSDRPHKLKDSWEMLDATGLSYDRSELQYINDLLLKPREELRLRANI